MAKLSQRGSESIQDLGFGNKFLALETTILDFNVRMDHILKLIEKTVASNEKIQSYISDRGTHGDERETLVSYEYSLTCII